MCDARTVHRACHTVRMDGAGTLLEHDRPLSADALDEVDPLLRAAALCGRAWSRPDGRWRCVRRPHRGRAAVVRPQGWRRPRRRGRRDPSRPQSPSAPSAAPERPLAWHRTARRRLHEGVPEAIVGHRHAIRSGNAERPIADPHRASIAPTADEIAKLGSECSRSRAGSTGLTHAFRPGRRARVLIFLGLIGIEDPVRPEVAPALGRRRAGLHHRRHDHGRPPGHRPHGPRTPMGLPGRRILLGAASPRR